MADVSKIVTTYLAQRMESTTGVNALLATRRQSDDFAPCDIRTITTQNLAPELMERANQALYPSMLVYCEKVSNTLQEKFRTFSGTARLTLEVRNSHDRLEALDSTLAYADVICDVLDGMRGEWVSGVFYAGGYEVTYSPVKMGGRHFLQSAKVTLDINVSE